MKKILGLIFTLIILGCGGYFIYINYIKDKVPKLVLEEEISTIDKFIGNLKKNKKEYAEIEKTGIANITSEQLFEMAKHSFLQRWK